MNTEYVNTSETRKLSQQLRQQAIEEGSAYYFTDTPCIRGHVAERRVSNSKCVECNRVYNGEWRNRNTARVRSDAKRRYDANPEKRREQNRSRYKAVMLKNPEKLRADAKKGYWANIDKRREKSRREYHKYKEKRKSAKSRYAKHNAAKYSAWCARRRAAKRQATPAWADLVAIAMFYTEAKKLQTATGCKYEVDHIVPLQGENVSGLHVENNLQVVTMSRNRAKHNRFIGDDLS